MPTWLDKASNSSFLMYGLAGLFFLIALWLVIVIVRLLAGGRLRFSGGRTRQARLGIVDAFDLDRQRQLIIVRRDNTEHLIMIGGPNDLLIEGEIVRVEARDNRRSSDKSEGSADNRIPAPIMVSDGGAPPPFDEPMLPMPLAPSPADSAPVEVVPRTPTFPLPPRRPVPPQPDRRPPPPPQSVSRQDVPVASPLPQGLLEEPSIPGPALDVNFPAPAPISPEPLPPIVPAQGSESLPPRPALPVKPPAFLKPLPPRPPIRPLRRATPVASGAPAPTTPLDGAALQPPEVSVPVQAPLPTIPPAAPPAPPAPKAAAETPAVPDAPRPKVKPKPPVSPEPPPREPDALESLEEEMAKLLGRG